MHALSFVSDRQAPGGVFVVGTTGAPTNATLLPGDFVSALSRPPNRQVVRLGHVQFYRYLNVTASGSTQPENVYALPTSSGVVIGACELPAASSVAFAAGCERVLASLRLRSGKVLGLGPDPMYASSLATALGDLMSTTRANERRLRRAETAAAQWHVAEDLAGAYRLAAANVRRAVPGPAERSTTAAIEAALTRVAVGYGSLARAAAHKDSRSYDRARAKIIHATDTLSTAVEQLGSLDYPTRASG
jgi:hypothetical protein